MVSCIGSNVVSQTCGRFPMWLGTSLSTMATENSSCISDFPFDMTLSIATVDCPRVYLFQNSIFSDRHVHSNFVAFRPWLLCDTAQPARLGWLKKTKHQQRAKRRGQAIPTRLIEAAGTTRLLQGARMTLLDPVGTLSFKNAVHHFPICATVPR